MARGNCGMLGSRSMHRDCFLADAYLGSAQCIAPVFGQAGFWY